MTFASSRNFLISSEPSDVPGEDEEQNEMDEKKCVYLKKFLKW